MPIKKRVASSFAPFGTKRVNQGSRLALAGVLHPFGTVELRGQTRGKKILKHAAQTAWHTDTWEPQSLSGNLSEGDSNSTQSQ
jgi:hypothetical protein